MVFITQKLGEVLIWKWEVTSSNFRKIINLFNINNDQEKLIFIIKKTIYLLFGIKLY